MWLFPVVIAPLFNRFEPVEEGSLIEGIRGVLAKAPGFGSGKSSRWTPAGGAATPTPTSPASEETKRIVLYDTLLASHPEDEILSVVAHEAGHWKRRHVLKQILLLETMAFLAFWLGARVMAWPELIRAFGFRDPAVYVGLFAAATLMSPAGFILRPLQAGLSRRFEVEADVFAVRTVGTAEPMIRSLKRLAADNLSNLVPHPLYAWFYCLPSPGPRPDPKTQEDGGIAGGWNDGRPKRDGEPGHRSNAIGDDRAHIPWESRSLPSVDFNPCFHYSSSASFR